MRVVVTGATGNVGTSVVAALSSDDRVEEVIGLARRPSEMVVPRVRWVGADVSGDQLVPLFEGAGAVVHLAWRLTPSHDPTTLWANNVDGSSRVFAAVADAGVETLVYASSVGAYSPAPTTSTPGSSGEHRVDESHPTAGIPTSTYSRQKAAVERRLDRFEAAHPDRRVVRLRKALVFKSEAASAVADLFMGRSAPLVAPLLGRRWVPVAPRHPQLRFQAVHSLDAGDAYRRAVLSDVRGAFNIAAEPVIDAAALAGVLGADRRLPQLLSVPVPAAALRAAADLAFRLRLVSAEAGWVDLALTGPLLDTARARELLGWVPQNSAVEALSELLDGLATWDGLDTPALAPRRGRASQLRVPAPLP